MAYQKKNLTNLLQSLADRHDSGVVPTSSQVVTFWTRLLNNAQAYCADRLSLLKDVELTTVSGTIALPDDFIEVDSVWDGTVMMNHISSSNQKDKELSTTFWITGNHTDGFYLNTKDDDTFTLTYKYRPPALVDGTDICVIPDPEAVVAHAYAYLRKSETDPIEDADQSLQEVDMRLNELINVQSTNSGFEGFTFQD